MPRHQENMESVSEILVDPQPSGLRAVYLVETRSSEEAREIARLFEEFDETLQIKQLCKGKLVSYAVQAHESDADILDEIELILKANYAFVVTQRSFDEVIYRIVRELCKDTGSRMLPMSCCNICGKTEPFPTTVVNLADEDGSVLLSRNYCRGCTAGAVASNNKEFVRSLLQADMKDFRRIAQADLVRQPTRRQPIRFKVRPGAGRDAAGNE